VGTLWDWGTDRWIRWIPLLPYAKSMLLSIIGNISTVTTDPKACEASFYLFIVTFFSFGTAFLVLRPHRSSVDDIVAVLSNYLTALLACELIWPDSFPLPTAPLFTAVLIVGFVAVGYFVLVFLLEKCLLENIETQARVDDFSASIDATVKAPYVAGGDHTIFSDDDDDDDDDDEGDSVRSFTESARSGAKVLGIVTGRSALRDPRVPPIPKAIGFNYGVPAAPLRSPKQVQSVYLPPENPPPPPTPEQRSDADDLDRLMDFGTTYCDDSQETWYEEDEEEEGGFSQGSVSLNRRPVTGQSLKAAPRARATAASAAAASVIGRPAALASEASPVASPRADSPLPLPPVPQVDEPDDLSDLMGGTPPPDVDDRVASPGFIDDDADHANLGFGGGAAAVDDFDDALIAPVAPVTKLEKSMSGSPTADLVNLWGDVSLRDDFASGPHSPVLRGEASVKKGAADGDGEWLYNLEELDELHQKADDDSEYNASAFDV